MEIEYIDIDQIVEYEENAKIHTKQQIEKIAASMRVYGIRTPVLLDTENTLIAGHGRKRAAQILGLESLPAIRVTDLTQAQIRAYRLLDNTLANSEWDFELLRVEFEELLQVNCGDIFFGFDEVEIINICEGEKIPEDNKALDEEELAKTSHECPKCGGKW